MYNMLNRIKRIDQKRRLVIYIPYQKVGLSPIADLFLLVFLL